MIDRAQLFYSKGYSVLAYDARGHGESGGQLISVGWYERSDLLGAIDYVRSRGIRKLGCLGVSQGGATILLAARDIPGEVKWAVVESAYPTIRDALDRRCRNLLGLPCWLAGMILVPVAEWRLHVSLDDLAPIRYAGDLRCPLFVMGGDHDMNTLPSSTLGLFDAVRAPKQLWIVPGAAHVDLFGFAKKEYEDRLMHFVSEAESGRLLGNADAPTVGPAP